MAFSQIDEAAIYACTGNPDPKFIVRLTEWLLSDNFQEVYAKLVNEKTARGYSLVDIIRELHKRISDIKFPEQFKTFLAIRMSEIEMRLSQGANEKIQVGSLVGAFIETRQLNLR
jgi:replication factor C subunit 3/5